jgi:hypothetical protein
MSVTTNTYNKVKVDGDKPKTPKLRFTLGESERYFEPAAYLAASKGLTAEAVKKLFNNPKMSLLETEGKSLKVMKETDSGAEVKFCGFVTAGDAKLSLDTSDIEEVLEVARNGVIKKAITGDDLIAEF